MPDPFKAAGIMLEAPFGRALFLKRGKGGDHRGEWCFPGGGIDGAEGALAAALRECDEETGVAFSAEGCTEKHKMIRDGVEFTTFHRLVDDEYEPVLNDEHTDFLWAPISDPPSPLHPGVQAMLSTLAMDSKIILALDKDSVRTLSPDGHMHVAISNISKAAVNPYVGKEIPGWEELGLDPNKIYKLLRDPDELEKAAASFNGKPVLMTHKPVNSQDHPYEITIGSTGTDAVFEAPFLKNSLVLWAKPGIDVVESGDQKEISCGYRYTADMTSGVFEGQAYDGVMRNIIANHVAIVKEGRAGRDVVVGDSNEEVRKMSKVILNSTSLATLGLLTAFVTPKMALDAKPISLLGALDGIVDGKTFKAKKADIVTAVKLATDGKLAKDASLDGLAELLDKVSAKKDDDKTEDEPADIDETVAVMPGSTALSDSDATDNDIGSKIKAILETAQVDAGVIAQVVEALGAGTAEDEKEEEEDDKKDESDNPFAKKGAEDEKDDDKEPKVTKTAMDAALAKMAKDTAETVTAAVTKAVSERLKGVQTAVDRVTPIIGKISPAFSFDSAEEVYRHTAKALRIDGAATMHPQALWPVIEARAPAHLKKQAEPQVIAQDEKVVEQLIPAHVRSIRNMG